MDTKDLVMRKFGEREEKRVKNLVKQTLKQFEKFEFAQVSIRYIQIGKEGGVKFWKVPAKRNKNGE